MSANINTAYAVTNKFPLTPWGTTYPGGYVCNGFSNGNLAGGVQPTAFSAQWCDAVQQELTNAAAAWLPVMGPSANSDDLGAALENQFAYTKPVRLASPIYSLRTQSDANLPTVPGRSCVKSERTSYFPSLLSGSLTNIVALPIVGFSQTLCKFSATVTQTDAITSNYAQIEIYASVRNVAGAITIQNQSVMYSNIPGIAYSFIVAWAGSTAVLRLTIPGLPAGKQHNAFAYAESINVQTTS